MPTTDSGKAIASRNATTHGLFARDVVLPSLGEDPEGYQRLEAQWMAQLPPRTLLERHYVEKIAAASWRLRRLHRWQAQLFEDDTLTENERLDRLDKVMRHETALHRQIDTAVKMLAKDAPQLYTQQGREAVLADARIAAREYHDYAEDAVNIDLRVQDHLYQIRKATEEAMNDVSETTLDTTEICENELPLPEADAIASPEHSPAPQTWGGGAEKCQNELVSLSKNPFRLAEYLDPGYRERIPTPAYRVRAAKHRRLQRY